MDSSKDLINRARVHIPGGVNSPVRAFNGVGGDPVFFERAEGPFLYDVEGRAYIDYVGSWGPAITGHAHPEIVAAVQQAAAKGLSFGAPCPDEVAMAERLCGIVPGLEMVRMVNSGTEATMSAVRVARAATGRDRIIKFEGCYHGHADGFLVKAGSGALTLGVPTSPGVPGAVADLTVTLPYNDLDSVAACLDAQGSEIAALIVEPVAGNMNCIPPVPGYQAGLRELCDAHGCLLIFDEVMTGFRVALGGAQGLYGVTPDLSTFGKVIGGGMPVGAFGGKREFMAQVAPSGPVYQAGTLSGNPVAMAAGAATLRRLLADDGAAYRRLDALAAQLQQGLQTVLDDVGTGWSVVRVGSILWLSLQPGEPPRRYEDIDSGAADRYAALHAALLARGIYLAPSAYEVMFVSLAHSEADIDETIAAFRDALTEVPR